MWSINGKRFWVRRADALNGLKTEEHQMFWERKKEIDIKDEDKIYINGARQWASNYPNVDLTFQISYSNMHTTFRQTPSLL